MREGTRPDIVDGHIEHEVRPITSEGPVRFDRRPHAAREVTRHRIVERSVWGLTAPVDHRANPRPRNDVDRAAPRELPGDHLRKPIGEPCDGRVLGANVERQHGNDRPARIDWMHAVRPLGAEDHSGQREHPDGGHSQHPERSPHRVRSRQRPNRSRR